MKEQTLCTTGDAVHAMIPSGAFSQLISCYYVSGKTPPTELDRSIAEIYGEIKSKDGISSEALKRRYGDDADKAIKYLSDNGFIEKTVRIRSEKIGAEINYYTSTLSENELASLLGTGKALDGFPKLRSKKQAGVLSLLSQDERMSAESIKEQCNVTSSVLNDLIKKGYISKETESFYRDPYKEKSRSSQRSEIKLSDEQNDALSELERLYSAGSAACALLHGVTGSGKTCVMMRMIDQVLDSGRSVILLIPEISLTPQTVEIFCTRYGPRTAVMHSSLSAGERLDAYMKIKRGEADLVIGTRSAVFAPVKNLGLIIIDEEQEHTYKSDSNPKYHARDIARYRCAKENALLLLASATPSVESYKKALDGTYTLIKLKNRYGGARLPDVRIVDMRRELAKGNTSDLSTPLVGEIAENLKNNEQSILFLNRRGYHNFVSCASCGEAIYCPSCSVTMTCHTDRTYKTRELVCHWCGKRMPVPKKCPSCGSEHIRPMGTGIQYVQKELSETFPQAGCIRMDTDTASSKTAYEDMLSDFRSHKADILLGTQMVTKGHDFPDVTLVGVINADASLYLNDFRAGEKTFAMLTQVIGRAGRADKAGRAVIQTSNPDSDVIKLACRQDYESFYKNEIKTRRLLSFPPYCDIVVLSITCEDETAAVKSASDIALHLGELSRKSYSDVPLLIFGPFEAPVYKLDGRYRMRLVIKCRLNKRSRELFSEIYASYGSKRKLDPMLSVDFNPSSL